MNLIPGLNFIIGFTMFGAALPLLAQIRSGIESKPSTINFTSLWLGVSFFAISTYFILG